MRLGCGEWATWEGESCEAPGTGLAREIGRTAAEMVGSRFVGGGVPESGVRLLGDVLRVVTACWRSGKWLVMDVAAGLSELVRLMATREVAEAILVEDKSVAGPAVLLFVMPLLLLDFLKLDAVLLPSASTGIACSGASTAAAVAGTSFLVLLPIFLASTTGRCSGASSPPAVCAAAAATVATGFASVGAVSISERSATVPGAAWGSSAAWVVILVRSVGLESLIFDIAEILSEMKFKSAGCLLTEVRMILMVVSDDVCKMISCGGSCDIDDGLRLTVANEVVLM